MAIVHKIVARDCTNSGLAKLHEKLQLNRLKTKAFTNLTLKYFR